MVTGSMFWQVTVPADRLPARTVGAVFFVTTRGIEFIDCPPAVAGQPTTCTGRTDGNALQGAEVRVFAEDREVATGRAAGPGSLELTNSQLAVVLNWGTLPRDLDAHLWISPQ